MAGFTDKVFVFVRYTGNAAVLVAANFMRQDQHMHISMPQDLVEKLNLTAGASFRDIFSGEEFLWNEGRVEVLVRGSGALVMETQIAQG